MQTFDILRREPDVRHFAAGATIFREGDAADCLYAVIEGEVEIQISGRVVERVGPGGVFGEMAIIDGRPRSGAALAAVDCELAAISEARFLRLVEQMPRFALQMLKVVTERLRRAG